MSQNSRVTQDNVPSSEYLRSPGAQLPLNPHEEAAKEAAAAQSSSSLTFIPSFLRRGFGRGGKNDGVGEEYPLIDTAEMQRNAAASLIRDFDLKDEAIKNSKVSLETLVETQVMGLSGNDGADTINNGRKKKVLLARTIQHLFGGGRQGHDVHQQRFYFRREQFAVAIDAFFLKLWQSSGQGTNMSVFSAYSGAAVAEATSTLPKVLRGPQRMDKKDASSSYSLRTFEKLFIQFCQYQSGTPALQIHAMQSLHNRFRAALLEEIKEARIVSFSSSANTSGNMSVSSRASRATLEEDYEQLECLVSGKKSSLSNSDTNALAATAVEMLFPKNADGRNKRNQNTERLRSAGNSERQSLLVSATAATCSAATFGGSFAESGSILFPSARDRYLMIVRTLKRIPDGELDRFQKAMNTKMSNDSSGNNNLGVAGPDGLPANLRQENRKSFQYTDPLQEFLKLFREQSALFSSFSLPFVSKVAAAVDRTVAQEIREIYGGSSSSDSYSGSGNDDEIGEIYKGGGERSGPLYLTSDVLLHDPHLADRRWAFLTLYGHLFRNLRREFDDILPESVKRTVDLFFLSSSSSSSEYEGGSNNNANTQSRVTTGAGGSQLQQQQQHLDDDEDDEIAAGHSIAFINSIGKDYFNGMRYGFASFIILIMIARRRLLRDEQRKAFLYCQRMCEKEVRAALIKSSCATIAANAAAVAATAENALLLRKQKEIQKDSQINDLRNKLDDDDHILSEPLPDDPYFLEDEEARKRLDISYALSEAATVAYSEKLKIREALIMSQQRGEDGVAATKATNVNGQQKRAVEAPSSSRDSSIFHRKMLIHHANWMFAIADPDVKGGESKTKRAFNKLLTLTSSTPKLLQNANTGFVLDSATMSTPATQNMIRTLNSKQIEVSKKIADHGLLLVTSGRDPHKLIGNAPAITTHSPSASNTTTAEENGKEKENVCEANHKEEELKGSKTAADNGNESPSSTSTSAAASAITFALGPNGSALLDPTKISAILPDAKGSIVPEIPLAVVQQQMLLMLQYSAPLDVSKATLRVVDVNDGVAFLNRQSSNSSSVLQTASSSSFEDGWDVEEALASENQALIAHSQATSSTAALLFGEDMSAIGAHGGDAAPLSTRTQEHLAKFLVATMQEPLIVAGGGENKKKSTLKKEIAENERKELSPLLSSELKEARGKNILIRSSRILRRKYQNTKTSVLLFLASALASSRKQLESNQLFMMPSVLWHRVLRRSKLIHYETEVTGLETRDKGVTGGSGSASHGSSTNSKGERVIGASVFSKEKKFYYKKGRSPIHLGVVDLFVTPAVNRVHNLINSVRSITGIDRLNKNSSQSVVIGADENFYKNSDAAVDDFYSKSKQREAQLVHERAVQRRIAAEERAKAERLLSGSTASQKQQLIAGEQKTLSAPTRDYRHEVDEEKGHEVDAEEPNNGTPETPSDVATSSHVSSTSHLKSTTFPKINDAHRETFSLSEDIISRLRQLAALQLRYGYFALTIADRMRWKKLIWDVSRGGLPCETDYYGNKPYVSRPLFGIPFNLLLAQLIIPMLIILSFLKLCVAHQRYTEIVADEESLLELFNEANLIAEAYENVQNAQRSLMERTPVHYDFDEVAKITRQSQIKASLALIDKSKESENSAVKNASSHATDKEDTNDDDDNKGDDEKGNPYADAGRQGGGDPFTSSSAFLFRINAVNPPASIPHVGVVVPNDYHTEYLVGQLDPKATFTHEVSAEAQRHLKSLPVLNSSQMTLLSKSQQVEMLQYALRNAGGGRGGGVGTAAGVTINVDTQRLLAPDFDVDSTTDFVINDVMLSFRDGFFTAAATTPSIVEVAQPKFAPSWIIFGIMQSLFTHV